MKKYLLIVITMIMTFTSCESLLKNSDEEYFFKADDGLVYKYSDFELYDSSTHIAYFKTNHPEFKTDKASTFSLLVHEEEIYKGVFWPMYYNSLPTGPFIYTFPSFYPDYAFRIEFMIAGNNPVDTRNDPRIISALKEHNLLHSGLSAVINSIDIAGTRLTFKFTVTNRDISDLLIIDPDKTGPELFHYFTNGLSIRSITSEEVFSSNIQPRTPSPWNSWDIDWLSELKSGDSRQFTINYTISSPLNSGDYQAYFQFPGLSYQVTQDQLFQGNKRIWLGDIRATKKMLL